MAEVFDFGLQQHKIKMDGKFFENNLFAVAGDTGRRLEVQLLDSDNLVQNTTGISLRLNAEVAGQATYAEATLVDATKGLYELDLPNGMLIAPGNWQFQWQIIGATGEKLHSFAFMGSIGSNLSEGGSEATNFYLNVDDLKQMQDDLINGTIDSSILETNITEKLTNLETQYAPNLTEVTAQLAETETELSKKPNKNETGWATLNSFDEPTRAVIQGLEPGEINAVLGEGNVLPENTSFFKMGKNKFNNQSIVPGYKVSSSGTIFASELYSASGFIPVDSPNQYILTDITDGAWYDSNKNYISSLSNLATHQTAPANGAFTRVSVLNTKLSTAMIELGTVRTNYEPFRRFLPKDLTEKHPITSEDIVSGSITYENTNFVKTGKNLHNPQKNIDGKYVNEVNGGLGSNAVYSYMEFTKISGGKKYTISGELAGNVRHAWYDGNYVFISGGYKTTMPLDAPSNAKYIQYSYLTSSKDKIMLEESSTETAYEPFGLVIPNLISEDVSMDKDMLISFLPKELCVASGRTIELYNKQVTWSGNHENYHIQWVSEIGRPFKRKWSFAATEDHVGKNYDLTLNVYDNNMKLVSTKKTVIKVSNNTIETPFSLLTLGDSLTNDKPWLAEIKNLSNGAITQVGTRGMVNKHEGRSGFSANSYLTPTSYSFEGEGVHPFWDGTRFNWNHYKTNSGVNPDVFQIFLGTNGIELDPSVNAGNIKRIVDYIRQDDPNIPIFVVQTLFRGGQDGIAKQASNDGYSAARGQWKLEEDRKVFNLMVRLDELLGNYSSLYFVPIASTHDSEYNFGQVETPVNPRSSVTEPQVKEATHPQTEGYLQMADIMFSTMAAHL